MPEVMTVISSDSVISGRYGPDRERRLGLPHEDAGGHVQRLGAAALHHAVHHDGEQPDHHLHQAVVIEDGEERRDEDDRRQHLEGEDHPVARPFRPERADHRPAPDAAVAERPEHEPGADAGEPEQLVDAAPSVSNTRWPIVVFSTISAKTICRPSPTRPSSS
jgi:hypothetical protein